MGPSSIRPDQDTAVMALGLLSCGLASYAVAGRTSHDPAGTSPS
jgi:hypothetical protein